MCKPDSKLMGDSMGLLDAYGDAEKVIAERVKNLDLRPHPAKYKQLSAKKKRALRMKMEARTMTKEEYEHYMWDKRIRRRRNKGIKEFFKDESRRINSHQATTRRWDESQITLILQGKSPRFNGRPLEMHHTYSVSQYPHLANRSEVIYPVTHDEHIKGWHSGNYKTSLPGRRIRRIQEF